MKLNWASAATMLATRQVDAPIYARSWYWNLYVESQLLAIRRQLQIQILAGRSNRSSDRARSVSPHQLDHWGCVMLVGKDPISGNRKVSEMRKGNKLDVISNWNRIAG